MKSFTVWLILPVMLMPLAMATSTAPSNFDSDEAMADLEPMFIPDHEAMVAEMENAKEELDGNPVPQTPAINDIITFLTDVQGRRNTEDTNLIKNFLATQEADPDAAVDDVLKQVFDPLNITVSQAENYSADDVVSTRKREADHYENLISSMLTSRLREDFDTDYSVRHIKFFHFIFSLSENCFFFLLNKNYQLLKN